MQLTLALYPGEPVSWEGPRSYLTLLPCNASDPHAQWEGPTLSAPDGIASVITSAATGDCLSTISHDPVRVVPCAGDGTRSRGRRRGGVARGGVGGTPQPHGGAVSGGFVRGGGAVVVPIAVRRLSADAQRGPRGSRSPARSRARAERRDRGRGRGRDGRHGREGFERSDACPLNRRSTPYQPLSGKGASTRASRSRPRTRASSRPALSRDARSSGDRRR